MTKSKSSYLQLLELSRTAATYNGIGMLLSWDQETYMPKQAIENRSQQLELIASLIHKEKTSKKFAKILSTLIDIETGAILDPQLSPAQQSAAREWRRDYMQAVKLPKAFVREFAKITSTAIHVWMEAKRNNDFSAFLPYLEKIIELCRKKADILGYEEHPYDALIDLFEPTMKTATLISLFERLKIPLIILLKKIHAKKSPTDDFLHRHYSHDKQIHFGKKLLAAMGFDNAYSRLDESAHPMCLPSHPDDTRMTTRVYPNQVMVNILSCIHEGGHGLYHTNLPREHFGSPLAEAASYAIDESQSRTWETILGRSRPFWEHFFPLLQKEFPENLGDVRLEDFYKALNLVKPSLIRTDSDEVTYNLHIMVRFELEKALLEGNLKASEIPDAWNEKMRQYLGVTPKADSEGCLQDIHWSMGAIGYFPTYTLGNLYAAQFFETFAQKHPHWQQRIAKGELAFISAWFKEQIHRFGRQYLPEDLCEKVTGRPITEKPFLAYLEHKYKPLYHLA